MLTLFARITAATFLLATLPSSADTHYVWQDNPFTPTAPYTNWPMAATNIQDAVDASSNGDTVLVSGGVYSTGGRAVYGTMTNRVAVDRAITLQSLMGPEVTIIQGYQVPVTTNGDGAIRCVYLTNGASLIGFTLTNGGTRAAGDFSRERSGGGLWCESFNASVQNCWFMGNCAQEEGGGVIHGTLHSCTLKGNSAESGGGASQSLLNNCAVRFNWASRSGGGMFYCSIVQNCKISGNLSSKWGGGAYNSALSHCSLIDNSAAEVGGGIHYGTLRNCIAYYNTAPSGENYEGYGMTLDYCCTTPLPPSGPGNMPSGAGNITNTPLFVDTNDWADLRLQSNSPCINSGNNTYVTTTNDLDGNMRIAGGTVDMGAYEYQSPSSTISYAWLQGYKLPTDGSVDDIDGDGDKATTWQEWKMWTTPTNGQSVLRMLHPDLQTNGTAVSWQSVAGHSYLLERASKGAAIFTLLQSGISGQAGTTSFTDTTATNGEAFFYRVGVPD